jgi:EpsD family peptidyl-prolyl cis-trans isomerase
MAQIFGFQRDIFMRQRIVITLLIALAATSCQKKASGQTVAVVNNEEITAADLNAALTNNSNLASGNTQALRNSALQELISRKLLVQQARSDGLDKSPEYLNQVRRATDDLLISMFVSKRLNTAQLPSAQEISTFEAAHPEMFANREVWTLNQIIYPLPKDAAVIAKLSAAKTLDEIAGILTASGIQFTRDTRKLDTAAFPHNIYTQVAGVKPGEPFIAPGTDKAVANVITAREPAVQSPDQVRALALNAMRREQVDKIVQDRVNSLRASAKIEYQPGFAPPPKK